jgi:putative transcriptional regulator
VKLSRFGRLAPLAVAILCGAAGAQAQPARAKTLAVGKLLVAARDFPDPTFAGAVILLVRYGKDGAVGLSLNRPTKAPISRVLQPLDAAKNVSDPVFIGGPVEITSVFALLRSKAAPQETSRVVDDVYVVSEKQALEKALAEKGNQGTLRVYLGYCGWAGGQLESELRLGVWHILDSSASQVFDSDPATLWPRMIAVTEQQIAGLRAAPGARVSSSLR